MSQRIITRQDYEKFYNQRYTEPENFTIKVCRSRDFFLDKLDPKPNRRTPSPKAADGVTFNIVRKGNGELDVRTSQYFNGQNVVSGFVILREVLTTQLLTNYYKSLNIRIYQTPETYLVVCGSDEVCNQSEPGDGGEGVKVKIPTPERF